MKQLLDSAAVGLATIAMMIGLAGFISSPANGLANVALLIAGLALLRSVH